VGQGGEPQDSKRAYTSALRLATIAGANFHSLRYTFASHLLKPKKLHKNCTKS
jgi:integrase